MNKNKKIYKELKFGFKQLNRRGVVSILLMLITVLDFFPPTVIAQSLPDVSTLIATPSSSVINLPASASAVLGAETSLGFSVESALSALADPGEGVPSANFQALTRIHSLFKKNFGINEKVSLVIDNPSADGNISTKLVDSNGHEVDAKVESIKRDDSLVVSILPPASIVPGKYTLTVEDTKANQKVTQDFTWGVLAINTNKSVYHPSEEAKLSFAVLDDQGKMVCDAKLKLEIKNQQGGVDDVLSTENGDIKVNPECNTKDFTLNPDYAATYTVGGEGTYSMDLTAVTDNGTYTIQDSFEVSQNIPFDIERISATRIYPANQYPVAINITANQDFNGTIVETVPESFEISQSTDEKALHYDSISVGSASTTPVSSVLGASTSLTLPFTGHHVVTSLFGEEVTDPQMREKYEKYGVIGHDGIDFDLPTGTSVLSVDDGIVVMAEENGDYGTTIVIKHTWGQSYYGHLSQMLVKVGDKVEKGEEIAKSGETGLVTGPHLHFGIKLNDNNPKNGYFGKIDPAPILGITNVTDIKGVSDRGSDAVKMISWNVSLSKGETVTLGYTYKAPFISPQFYTLGPLRLYENDAFIYGEARAWHIAADDTSPTLGAGTGINQTGVGTVAWGTPSNAVGTANSTYTTAALGKTATSNYLKLYNFGFSIPTGSTINGISVGITKDEANLNSKAGIRDSEVKLIKGGVIGGSSNTNEADTLNNWSTSSITSLYGNSTDTWGETGANAWTAAQINDNTVNGFGLAISAKNVTVSGSGGSETGQIDAVSVTIDYTPPTPDLSQIHYRWRNDDGSEANATFRRAEDTVMSRAKSVVMRLRVEVSNEGTGTATSTTYQLEYGTLSTTCSAISSWTAVPLTPTTEAFDIEADASGVADGTSTTNVTTGGGLTDENTTFVAGQFKDTGNVTSGISLTNTQFTELEYSLQANTNAINGTTYCFRVTNAGSTTNFTYPSYAQWSVGEPTMTQNHFRWRNDDGTESNSSGHTLYFNPTGDGYSQQFTVFAGCTSEWSCLDDGASDTSATPPTNNGDTSSLTTASGVQAVTLADNALPVGSTITQLDISAWMLDTNNPNTTIQLGYCLLCSGADNTLGTSQTVSTASYTEFTQQFASLSLSTTDLNNLQLLVSGNRTNSRISALYVKVTYTTLGASWKENEDTNHTGQAVGENVRLRMEVANTGGVAATRRLQIAYAVQAGGTCVGEVYTPVPTSAGSDLQMTDSTFITNEEATTAQLTATGSFTAGNVLDTANEPASGFSIASGGYTEMEYNFLVNSSASGKTYCFEVTDNGTDLDAYSIYPVLTVAVSGPTLDQLMRHGEWFNNSGVAQPFTF